MPTDPKAPKTKPFLDVSPAGMTAGGHESSKGSQTMWWRHPQGGTAVVLARTARADADALQLQIDRGIDAVHRFNISVGAVIAHCGSAVAPEEERADLLVLKELLASGEVAVACWDSASRIARSPSTAWHVFAHIESVGGGVVLGNALFDLRREEDFVRLKFVAALGIEEAARQVRRLALARQLKSSAAKQG